MPRPVQNPPNPWRSDSIEYLDEPPIANLEVFEEEAKSIVASNDSPDIGFNFSVNPYRGCYHACAYCYARPSHQYLGFGAGTDFERKIVVKKNAVELLRAHFEKRSWRGDQLAFSGVTDAYQPLEAAYRLTRGCLEVCLEYRNPVGIVTKGALIMRDAELLGELAARARAVAFISVPFSDESLRKRVEPNASPIDKRFAAMSALASQGVEVGVAVAPIIPGLNDRQIPEVLARAKDAGATRAFFVMLRLPAEVRPVFLERIAEAVPGEAAKIESALVQIRRGKLNESAFGKRMRGEGPRYEVIEALFDSQCRRLGLKRRDERAEERTSTFARPRAQLSLF